MDTVVTAAMVEPILENITSVIGTVLPVGVGIMGIMLGIRVVPRIFHMFF